MSAAEEVASAARDRQEQLVAYSDRLRHSLKEMVDWHERGDMDASEYNFLRYREAMARARSRLAERP